MNTIELEKASKVYRIYQGSRGILKEMVLRRRYHRPLWALKEISLQVDRGVAFGVIGNNGAGKSTLLKLITGTTAPTSGSVYAAGRIASLLELGIGFHPEFTGGENVRFTATLMGVPREEVQSQMRAIIEFSELDEFMDQPVKTYSSGMYLRLGFAIATAFDPDVLVIDEALAVGDQNFQRKCIERIYQFKKAGKNIVFCSHNMYQVRQLCDQALWLQRGECRALGTAVETVEAYSDFLRATQAPEIRSSPGKGLSQIESVILTDISGRPRDQFQTGEGLRLTVRARFPEDCAPHLGIGIVRNDGTVCYCTNTRQDEFLMRPSGDGAHMASFELPRLELLSGHYHFSIALTDERILQAYEILEAACPFTVRHTGSEYGLVKLTHRWS
jgi:lipopolysaccharide transport system ATP-binding protein